MKKALKTLSLTLWGIVLLMGATSCKKEKTEDEPVGEMMRIEASVDNHNGNEKTSILNDGKVVWDRNDKISLCSGMTASPFRLADEPGSPTSVFVGSRPGKAPYYACYPYDAVRTENGFTFEILDDQSDITVNAGPMAAYSPEGKSVKFENTLSWLKIGLKGNALVKKVTLEDKNGGKLYGSLNVKLKDDEESPIDFANQSIDNGGSILKIESTDGFQLKSGGDDSNFTWFSFLVPVGSLKGNIEIKVYGNGDDCLKTYTKTLSGGIAAHKVYTAKVNESEVTVTAPTVTTTVACDVCITTVGGTIKLTNPTTATVEYGAVYSKTNPNPTIGGADCIKQLVNEEKISGTKSFSVTISPIDESSTYYVRAYATNGLLQYGEVKSTQTPRPLPADWTNNGNGFNPHKFKVSSSQEVYFSQANLRYQASTNTWRFSDHQYDVIGAGNANISQTYDGWIDLFCWATSGYNHNNKCYQPWSSSTDGDANYYAFGEAWTDISGIADWGYNAISNGGNTENSGWRTMKIAEWNYLMTRSGKSAWGKVGCTYGVILLPEDFSWSDPSLSGAGLPTWYSGTQNWNNRNNYTYSQWSLIEALGAVFIPATGYRNGTALQDVNSKGRYWTSEAFNVDGAHKTYFYNNGYDGDTGGHLYLGFPVRLVRNAN